MPRLEIRQSQERTIALKLKRTEIYDEVTVVADTGTDNAVVEKFQKAVLARLTQDRFPIVTVGIEEVQVGGGGWFTEKRKLQAVVAVYNLAFRAIFVAVHIGSYTTFGLYLTAPAGTDVRVVRAGVADFDLLLRFDSYTATMRLVFDQVIDDDLRDLRVRGRNLVAARA